MKLSKEIKTAIIVFVGIGCFVFGFNFIKSTSIFSNNNEYYAIFEHSVGLQKGTPVTINGVQVGRISKVEIIPQTAKIKISFICSKEFLFSKNSRAEIFSSVLGNAGLHIIPALDNADNAQSGDALVGSIQKGLLSVLEAKIDPMTENLSKVLIVTDKVLKSVSNILDSQAQESIKISFKQLNTTVDNLNKVSLSMKNLLETNTIVLNQTLNNFSKITNNILQTSEKIAQSDVEKTLEMLNSSVASLNLMLSNLEQGKGTLGMLLTDKAMYDNLKTASSELGLLLEDLRRNPKRYVHFSLFGKKNIPYQSHKNVEPSLSERQDSVKD